MFTMTCSCENCQKIGKEQFEKPELYHRVKGFSYVYDYERTMFGDDKIKAKALLCDDCKELYENSKDLILKKYDEIIKSEISILHESFCFREGE